MGEVVESFKKIRESALEIARIPPTISGPISQKRKRDTSISNGQDLEKRRTRSSTRISSQEPLESHIEATYIEQSDGVNGKRVAYSDIKMKWARLTGTFVYRKGLSGLSHMLSSNAGGVS
jgi:hypothetical protein